MKETDMAKRPLGRVPWIGWALTLALVATMLAAAPASAAPTNACADGGSSIVSIRSAQLDVNDPGNIVLVRGQDGVYRATVTVTAECWKGGQLQGEIPNAEVAYCGVINSSFPDVNPTGLTSLRVDGQPANCYVDTSIWATSYGTIYAGPADNGAGSVAVIDLGLNGTKDIEFTATDLLTSGAIEAVVGHQGVIMTEAYNCDLNSAPGGSGSILCTGGSLTPGIGSQYGKSPTDAGILAAHTPELGSFVLFGVGALALGGYIRKRRRTAAQNSTE
jgi:hypothetical protein